MKESLDISVVMLSYYHEKYIEKAINSVITQETNKSFELIIGDDCSEDKTVEIIDSYIAKYPHTIRKIVHKENVGTTKNLCSCLEECKGRYITLLAGDDSYTSINKLEYQYNWLEENKDYIALTNTVEAINTHGEILSYFPHKKIRGKEVLLENFLKGYFYPGHGIMFRNNDNFKKSNYQEVLQQDRIIDDLSLCLLFLDIGRVYASEEVFYSYYIRCSKNDIARNYNSTHSAYSSYVKHRSLVNNLATYYKGRYDMDRLRGYYCSGYVFSAIKRGEKIRIKEVVNFESRKVLLYAMGYYVPRTIWFIIIKQILGDRTNG